jgi:hypothetical protein
MNLRCRSGVNDMSDQMPEAEATPIAYADTSTPRASDHSAMSPLTRHDVASLAVRILGIYIAVQGLQFLGFLVSFGFRVSSVTSTYAIIFSIYEAVGAVLILMAGRFGMWLLPKGVMLRNTSPESSPATDLQPVAFAIIGVLLAFWAVPEILSALWRNTYRSGPIAFHEPAPDLMLTLFRPAVQFLLGAWLFFGSKALARYWRRIRSEPSAL